MIDNKCRVVLLFSSKKQSSQKRDLALPFKWRLLPLLSLIFLSFLVQNASASCWVEFYPSSIKGTIVALREDNIHIKLKALNRLHLMLNGTHCFLEESDPKDHPPAIEAIKQIERAIISQSRSMFKVFSNPDYKRSLRQSAARWIDEDWAVKNELRPMIKHLTEILKDSSWPLSFQKGAARRLGIISQKSSVFVPELLEVFMSPRQDIDLRQYAGSAIRAGHLFSEVPAPALVRMIQDSDVHFWLQREAANILGKMGDRGSQYIPELSKGSNDPFVFINILKNAGKAATNYSQELGKILIALDTREYDRPAVLKMLETMGAKGKKQIEIAVSVMKDPDQPTDLLNQLVTAFRVDFPGSEKYIRDLVSIMIDKDQDFEVRESASKVVFQKLLSRKMSFVFLKLQEKTMKTLLLDDPTQPFFLRLAAAQWLIALGADLNSYASEFKNIAGDEALYPADRIFAMNLFNNRSMNEEAFHTPFVTIEVSASAHVSVFSRLMKNTNESYEIRYHAARLLARLGETEQKLNPELVSIINDPFANQEHFQIAMSALRETEEQTKELLSNLLKIVQDKSRPTSDREAAISLIFDSHDFSAPPSMFVVLRHILKNEKEDLSFKISAAGWLKLSNESEIDVPLLIDIFTNKNLSMALRKAALSSIGRLAGGVLRKHLPELLPILKDSDEKKDIKSSLLYALNNSGPFEVQDITALLNLYYEKKIEKNEARFLAHVWGGNRYGPELLLQWLPGSSYKPKKLSRQEALDALKIFDEAWRSSINMPLLREDLTAQFTTVITEKEVPWEKEDADILIRYLNNLERIQSQQVEHIRETISALGQ